MHHVVTRRTLIRGTTWAAPAAVVAAAAPAMAASGAQDLACVRTVNTAFKRYSGPHATLSFEPATSAMVSRAAGTSSLVPAVSEIVVPQSLTVANTGTEVMEAGLPIGITVFSLDENGIVNPNAGTLTLSGAIGLNTVGEAREALISPEFASPRTTLRLACPLLPGQQMSCRLTWARNAVSTARLASLQFLARITFNSSQNSYLECQSAEVLGGMS